MGLSKRVDDMGLFSRKSKTDKSEFNVSAAEVPEIVYNGIDDVLKSLVNSGSKDTKIVSIDYSVGSDSSSRKTSHVDVAVINGLIKYVFSNSLSKQEFVSGLIDRASTSSTVLSDETVSALREVFSSSDDSLPAAVSRAVSSVPEIGPLTGEVLSVLSWEALEENLDRTEIVKAESEWSLDFNPDVFSGLPGLDLPVDLVRQEVVSRQVQARKAEVFLDGAPLSDVTVTEGVAYTSFTPRSDEERLVTDMAQDDVTLDVVAEAAWGFDWTKVLAATERLMWKKVVDVTILPQEGDDEFALPDAEEIEAEIRRQETAEVQEPDVTEYTETDDVSGEQVQEEDDEIESENHGQEKVVSTAFDMSVVEDNDFSFEYPPKDDEHDDGGFDFGISADNDDCLTDHLSEDLRPLVNKVLHESTNTTDEVVALLTEKAEYNHELEVGVLDVEEQVLKNKQQYSEAFGEFNDRAIDVIGDQIHGSSKSLSDGDEEIEAIREDTHSSFFDLESTESTRFKLNDTRRRILTEIIEIVSELDGDHVQECIALAEAKIQGINDVFNLAFHSPSDDAAVQVDPALLDSTPDLTEFDVKDTPVFFQVVSVHGFNPFELLLHDSTDK
jgi:hypothetical protein